MPSWLNGTVSGCTLPAMSMPRVSITWSPGRASQWKSKRTQV
jgi:hypothetical protein